jgi:hypothetical protein
MSKISPTNIRKIPMLCDFVTHNPTRILILLTLVYAMVATGSIQAQRQAQKAMGGRTVRVFTRDGKVLEGRLAAGGFTVNGAASRAVSGETLLSINLAAEASPRESERRSRPFSTLTRIETYASRTPSTASSAV